MRKSKAAALKRAVGGFGLFSGGFLAFSGQARANLTIVPNFDSTIMNDPNAATIEATINTAISNIESYIANPVTVNITFSEMSSGLGQSQTYFADVPYTEYLAALQGAQTESRDDVTALATLPSSTGNPVDGNANIQTTLPLLRALGDASATPPAGDPDSTISFNSTIVNDSRPGTNATHYDLESVVAHEMDEVLGAGGAGSQLDAVLKGTSDGSVGPMDLFRYGSPGSRSYSTFTNVSSYFSIDGGNTDFVHFNQNNDGSDYGDWGDGVVPADGLPNPVAQVQDAYQDPGITPAFEPNIGPNELAALDVVGWNLTSAGLALEAQSAAWKDSTANNLWNTNSSANWLNGGVTTVFTPQDNVSFSDSNGSASGRYSVTLSTTVSPMSVTFNNSTGNYSITGTGTIADTGSFAKFGTGTLTIATGLTAGSLSISAGKVQIAKNTSLSTTSPASNVNISSLTITTSSLLDITNNHLIITYGNSDPIAAIYGYLQTGFNNGAWNGTTGIISSTAQTPTSGLRYGVGWADGNDKTGNVAGLTSGEILLKYTLLGDANLDGAVNGSDFSILAANFGLGVTNWDQGNFLFGSSVNGSDFSALAANFGQGDSGAAVAVSPADIAALDAFAAANGLLADVPEPGSIGILVAIGLTTLSRRRRIYPPSHRRAFIPSPGQPHVPLFPLAQYSGRGQG